MKTSYTITELENEFVLTDITNPDNYINITPAHPKFEWIATQAGRLININEKGHFNSSKDYHGAYNKNTAAVSINTPITLTRLDDLNIDASLFTSLPTGTIFDKFCSTEGGFLPGTNVMAAGAPGVGKTTVLLELLSKLQDAGKKVLFISAEMNQIDMARYLQRFPNWGQLPILFLSDYVDNCPKTVIESVLNEGWDIVLTDSYTEVNDTIKEECNMSRGKTEKWFLDLMTQHNKANNQLKKYTTFVTILQLSKGGQFVGSNKLKHMTTAMLTLDWDGNENSGRRFMEFSKNRTGQVGKKLYYELSNGVTFDEGRYTRDLFNDEVLAEERKALDTESNAFDKLFGFNQDGIPEELKTQVEEL
jgi:predicted ATP-dependent serine protease